LPIASFNKLLLEYGFTGRADNCADRLSGSRCHCVAIACVMSMRPELILGAER
jgi:energy-coupling factor transporter ATP-binding protein EcfA2